MDLSEMCMYLVPGNPCENAFNAFEKHYIGGTDNYGTHN